MFTAILWRFLILETFVMGALCRRFPDGHPQKAFCQSEFVLLVRMHHQIRWTTANDLQIEIQKVYKGDTRALNVTQDGFVILEMPRTCEINFLGTEFYFIFGDSKNGNLYTEFCDGNMVWRIVSPFYKRALHTYYKENCDCSKELPTKYNSTMLCHWWYSYMKRRGNSCSWDINSDLEKCGQDYG